MPELSSAALGPLLGKVRDAAASAGVFASAEVRGERLVCAARDLDGAAEYRVEAGGGRLWVLLATKDRWLSESIEADLMHTGDKLEELIDEELIEHGFERGPLPCEHFRNDAKDFIFRSPVPTEGEGAATAAVQCLLAYEACFRELGDMSGQTEE